ncbi:chorismate-binding protein [Enterovibrio coralii]|nr:chorismate-binding protein [Enterovibrio coralii]
MIGVGGGIVADSVPAEEYQETLDKGKGIVSLFNSELSQVFLTEEEMS